MAPTTWNIDPTHSDVLFTAKHMMVSSVRGTFTAVEGSILLDEQDPAASSGSFTIRVASLDTGVEQRDGHLRSADFFDVETYPVATFVSTGIASRGDNDYVVAGALTIRGISQSVAFDVEHLGFFVGMNGARRVGFHATGKINREDFGLNWNVALETGGLLVGKEIKLELDLAFEAASAVTAGAEGARAAA
jgi:polyisoprenoid-binding protein YceI